jgi:hypothetical protein
MVHMSNSLTAPSSFKRIHEGDLMGRAMGRKVAAVVWDKAQAYIHGSD